MYKKQKYKFLKFLLRIYEGYRKKLQADSTRCIK